MVNSAKPPAVDCVLDAKAWVGECALWHGGEQRLYWVDIPRPTVNRFDPESGTNEMCAFDQEIGCFGFREAGGFLGAFADDGFCAFKFESGTKDAPAALNFLAHPAPGNRTHRFNDGRTDPYGAFWTGTISL